MAVTLRVPPQSTESFRSLAAMPDDQFERLAQFVEQLPPQGVFAVSLGQALDSQRPDDRGVFFTTVNQLGHIMRTAERLSLRPPEIIEAIVTQTFKADDSDRIDRLRRRLDLLLGNAAINLHVRAWELLYEEQRYVTAFRIVTDLRPVFDETGTAPKGSVIVNHLHVSYMENNQLRHLFFALDESDINQLNAVTNRALSKLSALKKVAPAVAPTGGEQ